MFDLFAKLWLSSVKRMTQAHSRETARQRKLHADFHKAASKSATKLTKASIKASGQMAEKVAGVVTKTTSAATAASAHVLGRNVAPSKALKFAYKKVGNPAAGALGRRKKRRATSDGGYASAVSAASASLADHGADGSWRRVYQSSTAIIGSTRSRRLGGWLFLPTLAGDGARMQHAGEADGASRTRGAKRANANANAKPTATGLPLLVMLHGCGQTASAFAAGTRMNQLAARQGFAVLYPQQSVNAHPQRCWPWYRRTLQEGGDELALIAAMIERTCARHGLDARRVYVAGLSAGAALAHNLALRRPDLIAAVALHSGPVYGAATSRMSAFGVMQHGSGDVLQPIARLQREQGGGQAMPTLIIQGEQDQVVRSVNADQLFRQACAVNGLDPATALPSRPRQKKPDCDAYRVTDMRRGGRTLVRLVEVAHLAHAWSGGDAALRYNAASGPDASALLWAFVRRHVRAATAAAAS